MIRFIAAIDRKLGIAKHGGLPWSIPEDEKFFNDQTKTRGGHVLTGRTTFTETYQGHPLTGRHNYILTRQEMSIPGATVVKDLPAFLKKFENRDLWVAGGANVFAQIIELGLADELYLTHIDADFGCDQFFPEYEQDFKLAQAGEPRQQNGFKFTYNRYVKK